MVNNLLLLSFILSNTGQFLKDGLVIIACEIISLSLCSTIYSVFLICLFFEISVLKKRDLLIK